MRMKSVSWISMTSRQTKNKYKTFLVVEAIETNK
jgi:hypothetical protein